MPRSILGCAALLIASPAAAMSGARDGGQEVMVGVGAPFDGNPETIHLSIRGTAPVVARDALSFALLLPVTVSSAGSETFGVSADRLVLEVPFGVRLQALNDLPVRPYADAGVGPVVGLSETADWFTDGEPARSGWVGRLALGVGIGPESNDLAFRVEPVSLSSYGIGEDRQWRWAGMLGVGYTF